MRLKYLLCMIALLMVGVSCTTTEKVTFYVPSETKLYFPESADRAVTATSDRINLEIPSDMYCGYMLAQQPGSDVRIPIGIDYTTKYHTGTKAAMWSGMVAECAGGAIVLGSLIVAIGASANGDDEGSSAAGCVAGVGGGLALLGFGGGFPAYQRMRQTSYDYNFGYERRQTVEIPTLSPVLLNPNKPKGYVEKAEQKGNVRSKASSGKDVVASSNASGSKVNKTRSELSRKVAGTYQGQGSLMAGKSVEEHYSDISVVMERKDRNHVTVRVVESGEDYFDSPLVYEIRSNKSGGYDLKIDKLPEATIQITKSGKLIFKHKKVNIDNQLYTLEITGQKRK